MKAVWFSVSSTHTKMGEIERMCGVLCLYHTKTMSRNESFVVFRFCLTKHGEVERSCSVQCLYHTKTMSRNESFVVFRFFHTHKNG